MLTQYPASDPKYAFDYEVVVVDYDDPDDCYTGAMEYAKSININVDLTCIKVEDHAEMWNASRARNIGAMQSSGDYFYFVDADNILPYWILKEGVKKIVDADYPPLLRSGGSAIGTCFLKRSVWEEMRGYDELNIGWGLEDTDLYKRIAAVYEEDGKVKESNHDVGRAIKRYPSFWINVIQHGADRRLTFTPYKDKKTDKENLAAGYQANRKRMGIGKNDVRDKEVNPDGYGKFSGKINRYIAKEDHDPSRPVGGKFIQQAKDIGKTKFVIACQGRTASTNFIRSLNQHPDINCGEEVLGEYWHESVMKELNQQFDIPKDIQDSITVDNPIQIAPYYYNRDVPEKAVGMKLIDYQMGGAVPNVGFLHRLDVKVIHLYRRSKIDQIISRLVARRTDQWTGNHGNDDVIPHTYTEEQVHKMCCVYWDTLKGLREFVNQCDPEQILRIDSAEACTSDGRKRVMEFLGVDPISTENAMQKYYDSDYYSNVIINYDDVVDWIRGWFKTTHRMDVE
jgi:glycosyltransferase involved in cell wall biosynthesis